MSDKERRDRLTACMVKPQALVIKFTKCPIDGSPRLPMVPLFYITVFDDKIITYFPVSIFFSFVPNLWNQLHQCCNVSAYIENV